MPVVFSTDRRIPYRTLGMGKVVSVLLAHTRFRPLAGLQFPHVIVGVLESREAGLRLVA